MKIRKISFGRLGKKFPKIRKILPQHSEIPSSIFKNFLLNIRKFLPQKTGSRNKKHFFQLCLLHARLVILHIAIYASSNVGSLSLHIWHWTLCHICNAVKCIFIVVRRAHCKDVLENLKKERFDWLSWQRGSRWGRRTRDEICH